MGWVVYDRDGEIELNIFEEFLCKIGDDPPAKMHIVVPSRERGPGNKILGFDCRVVEGRLRASTGELFGYPYVFEGMPAERVAAAVRRYRARATRQETTT